MNKLIKVLFEKKRTQKDIAEKVGCSTTTMTAIVNDKQKPSVQLALKIAEELGSTVEEIWGNEEPKFSLKKVRKWFSQQ